MDNDGDGEADSDDSDCFACFSSGEPDLAGFSEPWEQGYSLLRLYLTLNRYAHLKLGDLCDDSIDNDGDGVTDAEDPDCSIEGGFVSYPLGDLTVMMALTTMVTS